MMKLHTIELVTSLISQLEGKNDPDMVVLKRELENEYLVLQKLRIEGAEPVGKTLEEFALSLGEQMVYLMKPEDMEKLKADASKYRAIQAALCDDGK